MKRLVLLDFDGVIANSMQANREVNMLVCPHITEEMHRKAFEGNIHEVYPTLLRPDHGPECHHDLDWEKEYIPRFRASATLFPGIADALQRLAASYALILVSSAAGGMIREFLDTHDLATYFTDIMGNDIHLSKVEKMRMIFEHHNTDSPHCVFATDTLGDMYEAQAHLVGTIGCSWGMHPRTTLERGLPFRIVDSAVELPDAVEDFFAVSRT